MNITPKMLSGKANNDHNDDNDQSLAPQNSFFSYVK